MEQKQSTTTGTHITGVITAAFNPRSEAEIVRALNEAQNLPLKRIILVHDVKGKSGQYVDAAKTATAAKLVESQIELVILPVNADETALRWRFGVDAAFSDPSVDCAFVLPSDFTDEKDEKAETKMKLREGLQDMASHARRDALVIGDFQAKPGSFKELFDRDLVGLPAVEAMYPGCSAEIVQYRLRKLRSEFFCIGRNVLAHARTGKTLWDMDPTISLVLVVLRAADLTLKVVDLGHFNDDPGTRPPLGQLMQIVRYVTQLIVNGIRLELSRHRNDSAQLATSAQLTVYDDLRSRIEAAFQACLEGIDANRRLLEREPATPPRKFNTNNKTRLSFDIGWQGFLGFSLLADPAKAGLVEESPGVLTMRNVVGLNELYDALRGLVFGPWGDALEEEFVFARLPHSSYHLTGKDGVNVDNIHLLKPSAATTFREFFAALPGSLAGPTSILPPPILLSAPIRFQFKKLSIWNRSALVARIEPVDAESRSLASVIVRRREELDREWEDAYGLPRLKNNGWSPHITLGYFPNRVIAPIAETRLARWSEEFTARIGGATCTFCSLSPYAFTNMATFAKSKGGR